MKKLIIALVIAQAAIGIVFGQSSSQIPIAIPMFTIIGTDVKQSEAQNIHKLLETAITGIPLFKVLERTEADKLYQEYTEQILLAGTETPSFDQIRTSARALLICSIGTLYGKVVITTRLVDLANYQILFANSIFVEKEKIDTDIQALAYAIRDKAQEMTLNPTEDDIRKQVKAKNYIEAKRLLDIYLRKNYNQKFVEEIYPIIVSGLAEEYYKQAQSFLKRKLFDDARSRINQALALKVHEKYYAFREQINATEEEYKLKQKLEEQRRKERLEQQAKSGYVDIEKWYENLNPFGAYLGGTMYVPLSQSDYSLDMSNLYWGGETFFIIPNREKPNLMNTLNWISYAGFGLYFETVSASYPMSIVFYGAPFSAELLRLGNVFIALGADAGLRCKLGNADTGSLDALWGYTVGGMLTVSVKAWEKLGIYFAAKGDVLFYLNGQQPSRVELRFLSGLSF